MYPLIHFFATNVGSSSHPALEFFSVDMTCVTSVYDISVITILCSILLIYDIGLTSLVMSLASFWPIDTNNLIKAVRDCSAICYTRVTDAEFLVCT